VLHQILMLSNSFKTVTCFSRNNEKW